MNSFKLQFICHYLEPTNDTLSNIRTQTSYRLYLISLMTTISSVLNAISRESYQSITRTASLAVNLLALFPWVGKFRLSIESFRPIFCEAYRTPTFRRLSNMYWFTCNTHVYDRGHFDVNLPIWEWKSRMISCMSCILQLSFSCLHITINQHR